MVFILLFSFVLTACASSDQLNLTESEETQITGYASGLLLKYNSNKDTTLVDTSRTRELKAKVEAAKAAGLLKKEQDSSGTSSSSTPSDISEGTQDIAEALGFTGCTVSYTDYEVTDTYPHDESTDEYFCMDATEGKELLVFHFNIENITDQDVTCNTIETAPTLRLIFNGEERKSVLMTLLLNDIGSLDETISPGEVFDAVSVLEVDQGYEASIQSANLMIKENDQKSVIPLFGQEQMIPSTQSDLSISSDSIQESTTSDNEL